MMDEAAAWTRFWRTGSACLPSAGALLSRIEAPVWRTAVDGLPRAATVLDLATGDGAVLTGLLKMRPDLRATGVDSATALPSPPFGAVVHAGVRMEAIPFPNDKFDLVTSRFGIEYGNTDRIAGEVVRLLRPGARLAFVCHHRDSELVLYNARRQEALTWAAVGSGILDRATALTRARQACALLTPASFAALIHEGRRRFPDQTAAAEFTEAVFRVLEDRAQSPVAALGALAELGRRAEAELTRLQALSRAALDAPSAQAIAARLRDLKLQTQPPRALLGGNQTPYAWAFSGEKPR